MKELTTFTDWIKQTESSEGLIPPAELIEKTKQWFDAYKENKSALNGYLIADHLETLAGNFKDRFKEDAYNEYLLFNGDEKADHNGFTITPVEGYYQYDYEQDDIVDRYNKELSELNKKLKPLKKEEKAIKDSIKSRQKKLVLDGKATQISSTKTLKISRK